MAGTRVVTVLSFWVQILLIAPFAYKLVQVDRAELPYEDIQTLADIPDFNITVEMISHFDDESSSLLWKKSFKSVMQNVSVDKLSIDFKTSSVVKREEPTSSSPNHYIFNVGCFKSQQQSQWVIIDRTGSYSTCKEEDDTDIITTSLADLRDEILLAHVIPPPSSFNAQVPRLESPKLRVSFTLLIENPFTTNNLLWDFESLASSYWIPFFNRLETVAGNKVTIESQVIQFGKLVQQEGNNRCYTLFDLQHFKSANDFISTSVLHDREPILNFYTFVSDPSLPAIRIANTSVTTSSCNDDTSTAFEIPGWGGVSVVSSKDENFHESMQFFMTHIRNLLGLKLPLRNNDDTIGLSLIEVDVLSRSWAMRNMGQSKISLNSISSLATSMPHMNILTRISSQVKDAIKSYNTYVSNRNSTNDARKACYVSNVAFYDETMVPTIYFPSEHLWAIYVPLFLPITLPLLSGLVREVKRYLRK